jgi:hypothetical protein
LVNFGAGGDNDLSVRSVPITVARKIMSQKKHRILYCHCRYAQVVPREVKEAVLKRICEADFDFEAVADLCEMAARKDPSLARLASAGAVKIAACFPRAVKGLFHQAGADLDPNCTEVVNMRVLSAEEAAAAVLSDELKPNLPVSKAASAAAPGAPQD